MIKVERSLLGMLPPSKDGADAVSPFSTRWQCGESILINQAGDVERTGSGPKAYIWITHSTAQAQRVGSRTVDITRR